MNLNSDYRYCLSLELRFSSKTTFTIGLILSSLVLSLFHSPPAAAQALPSPPLIAQADQNTVIHVNANDGDDVSGSGNESSPFKTITRALRVANSNTVIVLAAGAYNAQSGESFPLIIPSGVILQGDSASRGRSTQIVGGAGYLSPTVGTQNVTVVPNDGAGLTGLTISNPNQRGYAVWVESSSPVIADNTFTGSTHDGISVNGNSSPVIRNNQFRQNGANGITVFGTSTPEIRENIFENTGYGINIGENAAPTITGNKIFRNRSGIVVQGNGRPVIRSNNVEGNIQDGIVVIGGAQPDLGTTTEAGENVIRNNGQLDINAEKANQMIPAAGNQMARNRTTGRIDFNGRVAMVPPQPRPARPNIPAPSPRPTSRPAPTMNNRPYQPVAAPGAIQIPVPPPTTTNIATPPSPSLPGFEAPPAPNSTPGVLPVPNGNIPLGSGGAAVQLQASNPGGPPAPAAGLRYRVIVDATSDREQGRVRSVVPEAFRTFLNGRVVMQAGIFSSRTNAEELVNKLQQNGFTARLEELN